MGNLIIEFINDGLGLPMSTRDIAIGLNGHDPVLHDIIDNGINDLDGVDADDWVAPYDTQAFRDKMVAASQDPNFEYLDCWDDAWCEALDGFIPDSDLYYDHGWDTIIPEIPKIEIDGLDIPDLKSPEFWGVPNIQLTDYIANPLNTQNEFISFVDKDNNRMGAIKAESVVNWTTSKITPGFIFSLKNALFSSKLDKAHARAHFKGLIKEILIDYKNIGVQYSSGNGDYAEWLERIDSKEFISSGDIVGIKGGKITRDLSNAEQVMAVSEKPIVLGNVPEDGKGHLGNNIAFMGQIPVKVMGTVIAGDYIVGKGIVKGYGIAVNPKNMTLEDFKMTVGRSWEDSAVSGPKMVNTVIGVHNGDYINILKSYEAKFKKSEVRLQSVEAKIDELTELISKKSL